MLIKCLLSRYFYSLQCTALIGQFGLLSYNATRSSFGNVRMYVCSEQGPSFLAGAEQDTGRCTARTPSYQKPEAATHDEFYISHLQNIQECLSIRIFDSGDVIKMLQVCPMWHMTHASQMLEASDYDMGDQV